MEFAFVLSQGGDVVGKVYMGPVPDTPAVQAVAELLGEFHAKLLAVVPQWKDRLRCDPSCLHELEGDIRGVFAQGADFAVAGLLAMVMQQPEFEQACEQTRCSHQQPLRKGRVRTIQVRLLGGLVIWITSLYCVPRKSSTSASTEAVSGLDIELAQFGFGKGCTPALESRVVRQAALGPSFDFACEELARGGVRMDVKTVRRITYQCGEGMLRWRRVMVESFRENRLPAGTELRGKRVAVQFDGARTRLRGPLTAVQRGPEPTDADGLPTTNTPGRSRKRPKRTFLAEWREPKQLIIFTHDEHGRMEPDSVTVIDVTFAGPDAIAELAAMHLHRLGAAEAASITFGGDGAVWIWERIASIVRLAKLERVPRYEVLDCCHAAHHISLALAAMGLNDKERMPLYREHRTRLRNGEWRRVVTELTELAATAPANEKVQTEIAYLQKHGAAGRLKYPTFVALGLPLGSGAIESGIRRVINLRVKGNGIFWRDDNAEAILQVRCQMMGSEWDSRLEAMRRNRRQDSRTSWHWEPRAMNKEPELVPPNNPSP